MMKREEVYAYLCNRDSRNPYWEWIWIDEDQPPPPARKDCYCTNCTQLYDKLAMEILRLMDEKVSE